jgi:hypothetical protein
MLNNRPKYINRSPVGSVKQVNLRLQAWSKNSAEKKNCQAFFKKIFYPKKSRVLPAWKALLPAGQTEKASWLS